MAETDQEFSVTLKAARAQFAGLPDFQAASWHWAHELDDEGFFIFCYLVEDFNQQVLTKPKLEEAVYTLLMLRKKLLPAFLYSQKGISPETQFQILFNLYERLKQQNMSWEDCQTFIDQQIQQHAAEQKN